MDPGLYRPRPRVVAMATDSDSRTVVLTGANGGIGAPMARALVEDGYRVAGLDVEGWHLEPLVDAHPDRVRFVPCDVTADDDVEDAVEAVVDAWGRVDVLVNLAGVASVGRFDRQSPDAVRREFETNVFGCLRTIRAVLPHLRERGWGRIHNVSSGTAIGGHPGLAGYAATKGALEAFTRSFRLELRDEPIACTVMHPPMTATRLTADLDWPDWLLEDPATVGRKLARRVESTGPVVYADLQTRLGLAAMRRFPAAWRWATGRYAGLDG